jgi:HSP20 family protein
MDIRRTFSNQNAFRELEDMMTRLNRVVSEGNTARGEGHEAMTMADWVPRVDVVETEVEYLIHAELPGVEKSDVKISVQEGVLSVAGQRQPEKEEKGKRYHRVERAYGTFVRMFTVPDYVDDSRLTAEFKNGLLTIHLPKTEKAKPKSIEVKVN